MTTASQPLLQILIVEDNDINAAVLTHFLSPYGHHIHRLFNGQQALEYMTDKQAHLIMMDINMPVMNGRDASMAIRAMQNIKQPTIIAVTADVTRTSSQACKDAGMDEFLAKPYSVAQLNALVTPIFTKWRQSMDSA